jgi:hypothetical protein
MVQSQIRTLTSGTSSSHNRIKDPDLRSIVVPVPVVGSSAAKTLVELALEYERAAAKQYDSIGQILTCFENSEAALTPAPAVQSAQQH